jgi:hypothetical protein
LNTGARGERFLQSGETLFERKNTANKVLKRQIAQAVLDPAESRERHNSNDGRDKQYERD